VCYTMSRTQEANCNDCLYMRVVRDGVFQTVVSVAYSERRESCTFKNGPIGNSGNYLFVHRND